MMNLSTTEKALPIVVGNTVMMLPASTLQKIIARAKSKKKYKKHPIRTALEEMNCGEVEMRALAQMSSKEKEKLLRESN